jgi:hypothetical protein
MVDVLAYRWNSSSQKLRARVRHNPTEVIRRPANTRANAATCNHERTGPQLRGIWLPAVHLSTGAKKTSGKPLVFIIICKLQSLLFCNEWQQTNETSTQNSLTHGSLKQRRGSCPPTRKDTAFAVNQRSKCLQVFVVNIHRTWHNTTGCELAAHLLFLEPRTSFTKFLQICSGNCCHEKTYYLLNTRNLRADTPSKLQLPLEHLPGTAVRPTDRNHFRRGLHMT